MLVGGTRETDTGRRRARQQRAQWLPRRRRPRPERRCIPPEPPEAKRPRKQKPAAEPREEIAHHCRMVSMLFNGVYRLSSTLGLVADEGNSIPATGQVRHRSSCASFVKSSISFKAHPNVLNMSSTQECALAARIQISTTVMPSKKLVAPTRRIRVRIAQSADAAQLRNKTLEDAPNASAGYSKYLNS